MSGPDVKKGQLAVRPGYEVGYCKPPEDTRFQKGQSGNPRGRPMGKKNKLPRLNEERLKQIVLEEAYRTIAVRDGERTVTVQMAQAIVRAVAVNAVKGQLRAQRLFTELLSTTETANRALADEYMETAIQYKTNWEQELERRRRFNITDLPDPLPHPDHVRINMQLGTVEILGPMTKEDKALWDQLRDQEAVLFAMVATRRRDAEVETDPVRRAHLLQEIQQYEVIQQRTLQMLQD